MASYGSFKKVNGHYVDKIVTIVLKGESWNTYKFRWITRYNPDNDRYYIRIPKQHVQIRHLSLKRDEDFGPERLLPLDARIWTSGQKSRKKKL